MQSEPQNLTFFLPVMILIVVELSRVARDVDLVSISQQNQKSLIISDAFIFLLSLLALAVLYPLERLRELLLSIEKIKSVYEDYKLEFITYLSLFLIGRDESTDFEEQESFILLLALANVGKNLNGPGVSSVRAQRVRDAQDWLFSKFSKYIGSIWPPLGRFSLLHSVNFIILFYIFIFSLGNISGDARRISIMFVLIIWTLLPIFEVEEFDLLLRSDRQINSLYIHIFGTIIFSEICRKLHPISSPLPVRIPPLSIEIVIHDMFVLFIFGMVIIWGFTYLLHRELQQAKSSLPRRKSRRYYN